MGTTKTIHRSLDMLAVLVFSGYLVGITGYVKINLREKNDISAKFDALIKPEWFGALWGVNIDMCIPFKGISEMEDDFQHPLFDLRFSSYCSELDILKAQILILKIKFNHIVRVGISSFDYRNRKSIFENRVWDFRLNMDRLSKRVKDEDLHIIKLLQAEFQTLFDLIQNFLSNLELKQNALSDERVNNTVEKLQRGRVSLAVLGFKYIIDLDVQIDRIVTLVNVSVANFDNIFRYVVKLPTLSRLNGLEAMRNQLMKNKDWTDHRIWILATAVKEVSDDIMIKGHLMKVFAHDLTLLVQRGVDGLIQFFNDHGAAAIVTLKYVAPILVRTIYYQVHKSSKIFLYVLRDLTSVHQRLILINEFILLLKGSDDEYHDDLALIVFELVRLRGVTKPEDERLLKSVEENLPQGLRDLMYKNICIQNVGNSEYMYAGEPSLDPKKRNVYTAKTNALNETFFWQIHIINNGTNVLIRNKKYNEYLFLLGKRLWAKKLQMGDTMIPWQKSNDSWNYDVKSTFELDMTENAQFLIYNHHFSQMVYIEGKILHLSDKRPLHSRVYDPENYANSDSRWIFGFCRVYVEYIF